MQECKLTGTLCLQTWDINKLAPESLGGPFDLILASNAVHTCDNMAGERLNCSTLPCLKQGYHKKRMLCSCLSWHAYENQDLYVSCTECVFCAAAETLANVHGFLADGGFLLLYETTAAFTTCLWGLDERTWKFTDEREYGLWMAKPRWHRLWKEAGFTQIVEHWCAATCCDPSSFLLVVVDFHEAGQGCCMPLHLHACEDKTLAELRCVRAGARMSQERCSCIASSPLCRSRCSLPRRPWWPARSTWRAGSRGTTMRWPLSTLRRLGRPSLLGTRKQQVGIHPSHAP